MSIIERAAKRLEELYKAGIDIGLDQRTEEPASESSPASDIPSTGETLPAGMVTSQREKARVAQPFASRAHGTVSRRVTIALSRLSELGLVSPEDPRSQIAEEFRIIKRPLIRNATGKSAAPIDSGKLIMVTSALPGEGKSSSAVNLAMSMAMELDTTVLLVDADVAKPSLPYVLGLPAERGLLDVLVEGKDDLSDVILDTNIDRLRLLPSGTPHPRATELLASEGMNRLLSEMAKRYEDRILVFDSPPLLVTTEARALALHMGQIVFVVEAEHTTHAEVSQALATIEACPVKLLILNKSRLGTKGSYYGYHNRKGYGQYGYGS